MTSNVMVVLKILVVFKENLEVSFIFVRGKKEFGGVFEFSCFINLGLALKVMFIIMLLLFIIVVIFFLVWWICGK